MRFALLLLLAGCSGDGLAHVGGGPPDGDAIQDLAGVDLAGRDFAAPPDLATNLTCGTTPRSLSKDIRPLIGCGGEMCHGFEAQSAQALYSWWVDQTGRMECSDGRKLVAPGDPEHSYLIDKLTDRKLCSGDPMPKTFVGQWTPLPHTTIQIIYDWICQGAPNN